MTDLTAANIGVLYKTADLVDGIAGETLAVGDVVYYNSSGKLVKSDASAAGTAKIAGIVTAIQGRGVTVLKAGHVAGFGVSGLAYAAKVYLSDTAGKLADAAGTVSVVAGVVVPISDESRTKTLYVNFNWLSSL